MIRPIITRTSTGIAFQQAPPLAGLPPGPLPLGFSFYIYGDFPDFPDEPKPGDYAFVGPDIARISEIRTHECCSQDCDHPRTVICVEPPVWASD